MVAIVLTVVFVLPAAAGQFAGERFAPTFIDAEEPQLDITSITVDATGASNVTFTVGFRSGFPTPDDGYRVAVSVGDPMGKRWRWSVTMAEGQPVGMAETGDGTLWDESGPAQVTLDAAAGTAPLVAGSLDDALASAAGTGAAVWATADIPTPLGSLGRTTTYFSYEALASPPTSPSLPTSAWGWIRDADGIRQDGAVYVPGRPGTVAWVNRALVVSAPDPAPTLLLDQPVTASADLLRVLSPGDQFDSGGYVLNNRVTGEVEVFDVTDGEATEVDGAGATVVPASAAASEPPSTRNVGIDLEALGVALALPDDPSELAVTLDRAFTLGDGSVVTTTGVAATLASLQQAGSQPSPTSEPADDVVVGVDDESSSDLPVIAAVIVGAFAVLVVIAVVVAVLLRRRERRRHESLVAEGWFESDLAPQPPPTEAPPAPTEPEPVQPEPVEPGAEAKADGVELDASAEGLAEQPAEPVDREAARRTQERALADLEAQFADLIERADRLTHEDTHGE